MNDITPPAAAVVGQERQPFVEYPFPLSTGAVAELLLPKRLDPEDAERLARFIQALAVEA